VPGRSTAADIPATIFVLDGEVVVPAQYGVPDFGAVRGAINNEQHRLIYYAFDLLYLDGYDLRGAALEDRRRLLAEIIAAAPGRQILMSETIAVDPGVDLMRHACEIGLEGIVAKLADAP
jgi:bifunctional non-homologous end joining protein LigD